MTTDTFSPQAGSPAIEQAIAQHQAGHLQEAEILYQSVLLTEPNHPEANYGMGMLAMLMQQPAAGLPYFMTALDADPTRGHYWLSYIDALFQAGQKDDARQILAMARQQGLDGDEADELASRLGDTAQTSTNSNTESAEAVRDSLSESSELEQRNQNNSTTEPAKANNAVRKTTAQHKKEPSAQEINTLVTLFNQGRISEALTIAQTMIMLFPNYGVGWKMLGVLFQQTGRNLDALGPMQNATALSPKDAEAHNNLGIIFKELGMWVEAEASYKRALQLNPLYAEAHNNLGIILKELGRPVEAEASYRRALQIKPAYVEAHNNLGITLKELGRFDEAEISFRRAIQIDPRCTEAYSNLGVALKELGRLDEAETSFRQALQFNPEHAEANYNLGNTLTDMNRLDAAEACYRRALQINPDYAEANNNLGKTLRDMDQLDAAEACYRRALQIKPDSPEMLSNLGSVLNDLGRADEAEVFFRRALKISPEYAPAYNNMLFSLSHNAAVDGDELFIEHCRFGERFETPYRANWPQHHNSRNPERRLRVGFVSGDLRNHAVSRLVEPVLANLVSCPMLDIYVYYNNANEDQTTLRMRKLFTNWSGVAGLSDVELTNKIMGDQIDILIDLSGHTAKNRLLTFARKPAPVQASWLGYPATTGLCAMDYYLSDRNFLPLEQFASQFTEKIVHLPAHTSFLPHNNAPLVNPLPALSNGYVTFGSFNRRSKINRSVIKVWAKIMRSLQGSRLLIGGMPEGETSEQLAEMLLHEGISRERVSFHGRSNMDSLHHQVDLCLDTFPCNGGTTTIHALWMGVPTITLAGRTAYGRIGASILGNCDLGEFVADDEVDFVKKALFWAGNLGELSEIRSGLRDRFSKSAMGRPDMVAAGLERAFRIMWQRWCAGLPAIAFEVKSQDLGLGIIQTDEPN
jgi:predicted O-linked N-acetylglucosamine transferase (SPINDLY family)